MTTKEAAQRICEIFNRNGYRNHQTENLEESVAALLDQWFKERERVRDAAPQLLQAIQPVHRALAATFTEEIIRGWDQEWFVQVSIPVRQALDIYDAVKQAGVGTHGEDSQP